jgi:hypothetical protein
MRLAISIMLLLIFAAGFALGVWAHVAFRTYSDHICEDRCNPCHWTITGMRTARLIVSPVTVTNSNESV